MTRATLGDGLTYILEGTTLCILNENSWALGCYCLQGQYIYTDNTHQTIWADLTNVQEIDVGNYGASGSSGPIYDSIAIYDLPNLETVSISATPNPNNTVLSVGFSDLPKLDTVAITRNNVTFSDGDGPQCYGCPSLKYFIANTNEYFADQTTSYVLYNRTKDTLIRYPPGKTGEISLLSGVSAFERYAFAYCPQLTTYTIPPSVTTLGAYCFEGCSNLSSVSLHEGITTLNNYCFGSCRALASIALHNYITSFGNGCFSGCIGLTSLNIPASVISIGRYCFSGCYNLTNIWFRRSTVPTIEANAFSLGTSAHPTTVTVKNKEGWPQNVPLETYSNQYTTFVYQYAHKLRICASIQAGYSNETTHTQYAGCPTSVSFLVWDDTDQTSTSMSLSASDLVHDTDLNSAGSRQSEDPTGDYAYFYDVSNIRFTATSQISPTSRQETRTTNGTTELLWPTLFDKWELGATSRQVSTANISTTTFTSAELVTEESGTSTLVITYKVQPAIRIWHNFADWATNESLDAIIPADPGTYILPDYTSGVQIADRWVSNTCWYDSTTGESAESFDSFITSEDPPSYEWFAADTEVIVVPGRLVRINPVISTPDINLDAHPFAIVFDPAGGTLESPQWFEETQRTAPSANVGTILFDYTKNRWIWYSDSTEKILPVTFSNLPYSADTGLVPPAGIESARSWVIAAPFNESSAVSVLSPTCTFELELKRSSQDAICQKTSYPEWVPERGDQQRAFITAPGYGYMDLGHIQSINEVYTPQVQQIPIVVYGFKNSFCMDTGVKKEIELQYIRTQPATPLDESGDSRVWSNAKWIRMLKEIMNRWQMRTNGNKLYILRPANEIEEDPMRTYTDEIVGLNCYISQVPIAYGNMPHALQGRISFKVGTLYPKQRELALRQVRYTDPDNPSRSAVVYTSGRWLTLPSANAMWPPTDSQSRIYGDWSWTTTDDRPDTGAPGRLVDLNTVSGTYEYVFSANAIYDGEMQYRVVTDVIQSSFTVQPESSVVTIFVAAVGGGGGGGAGRAAIYEPGGFFSTDEYRIPGGGGGGAGMYIDRTYMYTTSDPIVISYSVGSGGSGGVCRYNQYGPGIDGIETQIKVGEHETVHAYPGKGGDGGNDVWDDRSEYVAQGGKGGDSQGSYSGAGGSGGQRNHDAESGNYPSLSDIRTAGPGQAYPNQYMSISGRAAPKPNMGPSMTNHNLGGIDVGGGGGAAIWCGPANKTIYPDQNGNDREITLPGKGGDGAYYNTPATQGYLGGGGGGGGGATYIRDESVGDDGRKYKIYQMYPGAKGGDGYIFISVAGGTIS